MSEIEKMYRNANVRKHWNSTPYGGIEEYYPPFTAGKQIELIKWLKDNRDFHTCGSWCTALDSTGETIEYEDDTFEEALAGLINQLFMAQDLTEEEKQQVKGILE